MKINKALARSASLIVTLLLVFFSYRYITHLINQVDFKSISINWLMIFCASILFVSYYLMMSINWVLSARLLREDATSHQSLVFFASQPYKYLPTSFFIFSSRAVYGKRLGLTLSQASIAQIFENLSLLVSNFSLFAVLYLAYKDAILGLVFLLVLVSALIVLHKHRTITSHWQKHKVVVETPHLIKMYLVTLTGWVLCGLSFAVFNVAIGLNFNFLYILAANTIAFSLSMLAFFAPGGIGVREFIYGTFGINSAVILFWRIFVFVFDMVLGFGAILAIKLLPETKK